MSKSATGTGHAIGLLDPPNEIKKKINRATTDSNPAVDIETMGPGVANLLNIYQAFTDATSEEVRNDFAGLRYGDMKKKVIEAVVAGVEPIQKRYAEITADPAYLNGVLKDGAERVRPIAESTTRLVRERMGLYNLS